MTRPWPSLPMAPDVEETQQPLLAGVEIGGTKLQVAIWRRGGDHVYFHPKVTCVPSEGAPGVLRRVRECLGAALKQLRQGSRPDAIGIGFGGPVEDGTGRVVTSHQVVGWDGFDLAHWMLEEFGCDRVRVANDSDTAALGEALMGAGDGRSPVLYVNSGSGVGGGLVVDGRIYRGGSGLGALEFGHLVVDLPTRGSGVETGTVESFASGWAIERRVQERLNEQLRGERPGEEGSTLLKKPAGRPQVMSVPRIGRAAMKGDQLAVEVLDEATRAMGRGLAHAVTLLAPRRVILGGGVSLLPKRLWLEPIREELDRRVFPPFRGRFDVVRAEFVEEAVVWGALMLAVEVSHEGCSGSLPGACDGA